MRSTLPLVALLAWAFAAAPAEKPTRLPYTPTADYGVREVEGWRVLVHPELRKQEHEALAAEALRNLEDHLYRIGRVVPAGALAKLRKVPIWVERAHPKHACMCYHTSPEWLRRNGMNPDKAGAVEVANCRTFLDWTRRDQPWMVLHELAHAYHDRVLGWDHAEVRACFERAVRSKAYESVLNIGGRKGRHYALNNEREYFAEATEAFFGTNDFYPFVRAELRAHDPAGYELLAKLWGEKGT